MIVLLWLCVGGGGGDCKAVVLSAVSLQGRIQAHSFSFAVGSYSKKTSDVIYMSSGVQKT